MESLRLSAWPVVRTPEKVPGSPLEISEYYRVFGVFSGMTRSLRQVETIVKSGWSGTSMNRSCPN